MPLVVVHFVTGILAAFIVTKLLRRKFTRGLGLAGALAGTIPDYDFALSLLAMLFTGETNIFAYHRVITHSFLWPALMLLLAGDFALARSRFSIGSTVVTSGTIALFLTVCAAAWFTHVSLDCSFSASSGLSWYPGRELGFCSLSLSTIVLAMLDGILLIAWIVYAYSRGYITRFL